MIPHSRIRSALRQLWWRYDTGRSEAIKRARMARGIYLCAKCGEMASRKDIEIDHVEAVGPTPGSKLGKAATWDLFVERLFVPAEGLQVLCRPCHDGKTNKARKVLYELR